MTGIRRNAVKRNRIRLVLSPSAMQRRLVSGEKGQSILEISIALPLLLLLMLGAIELGRYAYYSILVYNAARAGAQFGAQSMMTAGDTAGIQSAAVNDAQNVIQASDVGVTELCGCASASLSACSSATGATGCSTPNHGLVYVQVTTQGTFHSLFNYPGIPPSITLNGKATERVAQ